MPSQLNIALMFDRKPKPRPRFATSQSLSFTSPVSLQVKKRRSRRPRRNRHTPAIQGHTNTAGLSKTEVKSPTVLLKQPSSTPPCASLKLPLRANPVSCAELPANSDLLKASSEEKEDEDDLLELISSSQASDTSISLERFKSHPPTKFTKITSVQLADQMARLKEHNTHLQQEAARSELRSSRLKSTNKLLVEHRAFVEDALRVCQETYRHEADSAQMAGIHPRSVQYEFVVNAIQELRDDIGYENFCNYRTKHGSPPPSRYWLEGALKLQEQFDKSRS